MNCHMKYSALLVLSVMLILAASQPVYAGIVFVKADATGADNGSSWEDAYTDLQDALTVGLANDSIWVAQGIYKTSTGFGPYTSFELKNNVSLYGGFTGNESSHEERDWVTNETILSGNSGLEEIVTDNSYNVVSAVGTDSTALLDGFTIMDGYDDRTGFLLGGGGLYASGGSPTIKNIIFTENFASYGGGLFNRYGDPKLTNVTFIRNSAGVGGGMYSREGAALLQNVTFSENSAEKSSISMGGGLLV